MGLESTTSMYGNIARTGFIEGIVFSALVASGSALAGSALAISVITGLATIGLSIGLSYLAQSLFRPAAPKPEDVQSSIKQPTAARTRHYGRVKASGPWVFAEAEGGSFHKIIALGQGPIDGIEEFWIDDYLQTFQSDGLPTSPSKYRRGSTGDPLLRVLHRNGNPVEPYYWELNSKIPQWTSDHTGDGVASIYAHQFPVEDKYFMNLFPNGINTNYRAVLRGARVNNPITNAHTWNDNAAAIIRDYLTHKDGMRLPASLISTPEAHAGWVAAYNRAAEAIPRLAGGTEPRYRIWGSYLLSERPADVLGRMLQVCDGRLKQTNDGGLTLDIGQWSEPSAVIGPDAITGFTEFGRSRDILTTANTIRATYLEPSQDYQAADADPWADEDDVSERGEIGADYQLHMSPSHGQTRRLMKLAYYRANPTWVGMIQCNLRGLAAAGERFIRLQYPLFGINSVFEVQDFKFNIGEGGTVTGVTLQVQSMPSSAYQWTPDQEGVAPVMDETEGDDDIPTPNAPTVFFLSAPLRAQLTFTSSGNPLLSYVVRWKKTADSEWEYAGPLDVSAVEFITPELSAATEYEFQLMLVTEKGREGDWSASTIDTTP